MSKSFQTNKKNVLKAITSAEKKALLALGEVGDGWIKAETPVDTGNLRGANGYVINEEELSVTFGNNTEYAVYVHEGTSRNNNKQPFLRNTIESRANDIKNLVAENMKL